MALLGMIGTHTLSSSAPGGSALVHEVAGGRSSALFAVLAGASMALMSGRTEPLRGPAARRVTARLAVRALLVAMLGLLLGELDTSVAVILTYYGVLFGLGLGFLRLDARHLAVLAAVWALAAPVVSHLVRPSLPSPSYLSPSFASLSDPGQLLSEITFTGYYPVVPWLAYLLAGMAIGRSDLADRWVATVLAAGGACVALVAEVVSRLLLARPGVAERLVESYAGPGHPNDLEAQLSDGLFGVTPTGSGWWLAVSAPHSGTPLDLLHTIGTSAAVVGVALLLATAAPRVLAVVFGAGAMTLTLYSLHVVLLTSDAWSRDSPETFLRHAALVLAVGALYRLLGRSGPLERLVALVAGGVVPDKNPRDREAGAAPH